MVYTNFIIATTKNPKTIQLLDIYSISTWLIDKIQIQIQNIMSGISHIDGNFFFKINFIPVANIKRLSWKIVLKNLDKYIFYLVTRIDNTNYQPKPKTSKTKKIIYKKEYL